MNKVKVSVILAVYNVQEYLVQCLDSLVNQTLKEIEIICVNDCSTDNSLKILEEYAQKDSRIKIINMEKNSGQGQARNRGIEIAQGDYLGFVDPDDWAEVKMFETLYNIATQNDCDLVECNHYVQNEIRNYRKKYKTKLKFPKNKIFSWKDMKESYAFSAMLAPWNKLYKTEFIKNNSIKFDEGRLAEDQIFGIKARLLSKRIRYCPASLYNYRIRKSSSVNTVNKDVLKRPKLLKNVKKFLVDYDFIDQVKDSYNKYIMGNLIFSYKGLIDEWIVEYEQSIKEFLGEDVFIEFTKRKNKTNKKFIDYIFSVKNEKIKGLKYKVITILGIRIQKPYAK